MTNQQMFNRAVRGLSRQKWRRSYEGGVCRYTNDNGDRCAWGHVETKPELLAEHEGQIVDTLIEKRVGVAGKLRKSQHVFARKLQQCHDEHRQGLRDFFREFGQEWGLKWPRGVK
jgi:hypothetical protein